jgi:hypothetical protein
MDPNFSGRGAMRSKISLGVIALAVATCIGAGAPKSRPKPAPFEMGPLKGVTSVAFSADSRSILAVGYDKPA